MSFSNTQDNRIDRPFSVASFSEFAVSLLNVYLTACPFSHAEIEIPEDELLHLKIVQVMSKKKLSKNTYGNSTILLYHSSCRMQRTILCRSCPHGYQFAGSRLSFSHDLLGKSGVLIKVDGVFCLS
jgi:hypothetical protein